MTETAVSSLSQFMAVLEQYVPGMVGRIAEPAKQQLVVGQDNQSLLQQLLDDIEVLHPEAGFNYASVRVWNLMTWQPVVLVLASVYVARKPINLDQLGQNCSKGLVAGYSLSAKGLQQQYVDIGLLEHSARQLKQYSDALKEELLAVGAEIKSLEADRLLADRMLSTLVLMKEHFFPVDTSQFIEVCNHWLDSAGLRNASQIMRFPLLDGTEQVALNRKGCCLHYRTDEGDYCATCPRLKMEQRVERLQQEWSGHAAIT